MVGVPGRVVIYEGERIPSVDLNHEVLPDPVAERMHCLQRQIDDLRFQQEKCLKEDKRK